MRLPSRWVIDPETGRTLNGKSRPFRSALFFYPKGASPRSCHRPDTEDRTTVRNNPAQSGTEGVHPNPGTGPQGPIRSNRSNAAKVETLLQQPRHADTRQTNPEKHKRPATGRFRLTTKIRTAESAVRKAIRQKIRRQKTVRRGPGGESSRTANGFPEGTVRLLLRTMPEGVRNRTPVGRFRG